MIEYKVALLKTHNDIPIHVSAVNSLGQFVGSAFSDDTLQAQAFLYDHGDVISLPNLGYETSFAEDINDSGDICGWVASVSGDTLEKASLWTNGGQTASELAPLLGGTASQAFGLNSLGDVTGRVLTAAGDRAFRLSNGAVVDLGTLSGPLSNEPSVGYDINDDGHVVGQSGDIAFVYADGLMSPIDTYLVASGINQGGCVTGGFDAFFRDAAGAIVKSTNMDGSSMGYAVNSANRVVGARSGYAFRWDPGKSIENLNHFIAPLDHGDSLKEAIDINNHGQIVGTTQLGHGFLLTPIHPIQPPQAVPSPHNIPINYLSMVYILAGIIGGGGGIIRTPGGKGGPVPDPGGPPDAVVLAAWRALAPGKRDILMGLALDEVAALISDASARRKCQDTARLLIQDSASKLTPAMEMPSREMVQARVRLSRLRKLGRFSAGT